ncbi:unnamed protein product, partial [Tenebrio molitor]
MCKHMSGLLICPAGNIIKSILFRMFCEFYDGHFLHKVTIFQNLLQLREENAKCKKGSKCGYLYS